MKALFPHSAGTGMHERRVVSCCCHTAPHGHVTFTLRTFGIYARSPLLVLQTCLVHHPQVHESCCITLLEGNFSTTVGGDPCHMKNVLGRETNGKDAAWIAVLRHDLLLRRASFQTSLNVSCVRSRGSGRSG